MNLKTYPLVGVLCSELTLLYIIIIVQPYIKERDVKRNENEDNIALLVPNDYLTNKNTLL